MQPVRVPLRVLVVEDSEDDANINVRMLERAGFAVEWQRVDTPAELERALAGPAWDVVLCDYHMPAFTGMDALLIVKGTGLDVPFVLVSGALGEEGAVAVLTAGASDYVMKGQLGRLGNVVGRELEKAAARRAEREAQRRLQLVIDNVAAMICYVDAECRYAYANLRYRRFYAGGEAAIDGRHMADVLTPDAWRAARPHIEAALAGDSPSYSGERRRHDGSVRHVSVSLVPDADEKGAVRGVYVLAFDVTGQHRAELALRESEAGLRHAQQMARVAHVIVEPGGTFQRWSESWSEIVGIAPARLPRSTREALEHVHPEDRERFRATAIEAARLRRTTPLEFRWRRDDGTTVFLRQTMEPMPAAGDAAPRWFVAVQDVTDQKQAEERIRRLNRVYAVLSGINGALVRIRDRQELFDEACRIAVEMGGFRFAWICTVDDAAGRLVPRASAGADGMAGFLEGIAPRMDVTDAAPQGHGVAATAVRENRAIFVNDIEAGPFIGNKELHRQRGLRSVAVLPLAVGGRPVGALGLHSGEAGFFDEEEQRLLLELAGDIAFALDHMEKEERVRYLAYYDPLTGLANRALLLDRLAQQLAGAGHEGMRAALVLVNIGRFKAINDARGRQAGDALLRQVAGRLVESAGDAGNVARVGGDQFAVIVPRVRRLESLVRRIEEAGRAVDGAPYPVDGAELRISTRAGVAMYPEDGADADTLFHNAEAALKSAESGDRFLFYAPRMTARVGDQLRLENQMRLALEQGEFVLHYQPKYSLEPQRITGAEVLIRWENPGGGLVPPMDFIPLLEETGLIAEVGRWALAQAVADHVAWRKRGLVSPRIAVNVSAVQLRRGDFVASLKALLASAGADPGIDLEITETLLMSDLEENIAKLRVIRDMGVNIVVDDFGTGYSSLAYLARLPAAAVKIDRSFVHDMTADPDAMTLVNTIVSLGHSLRLKVIAEGVETQAQADYLRVMRCDEVQGFLFGRPMPAAEFERLLTRGP